MDILTIQRNLSISLSSTPFTTELSRFNLYCNNSKPHQYAFSLSLSSCDTCEIWSRRIQAMICPPSSPSVPLSRSSVLAVTFLTAVRSSRPAASNSATLLAVPMPSSR